MIGDKRYEGLREELEDIVDQIKIGDGILVEHPSDYYTDRDIGYVQEKNKNYLRITLARNTKYILGRLGKYLSQYSGDGMWYDKISDIKIVDPINKISEKNLFGSKDKEKPETEIDKNSEEKFGKYLQELKNEIYDEDNPFNRKIIHTYKYLDREIEDFAKKAGLSLNNGDIPQYLQELIPGMFKNLEQIADKQYTGNEYHPIFGKFRGELDFYEYLRHVFDKQVNQVEIFLDKAELRSVERIYLNEKLVKYRKIIQDKICKD